MSLTVLNKLIFNFNNEQQETIDLLGKSNKEITSKKDTSDLNLKLKSVNKTYVKNHDKKCPVSGCKGLGNTRSNGKTHRTIASCPMKEKLGQKQKIKLKKQQIPLKPRIHLSRFFEKNNENSEDIINSLKSTVENLRQDNLNLRTQITHSV